MITNNLTVMKKFMLMVATISLLSIPAANAQKVNKEATLSKLEKSDADIANPKKNTKAATWINRGKVYFNAAAEPTNGLFAPMETAIMKISIGEPTSTEEVEINGSKAVAWNYPYFIAYEKDGKIVAWKQLQEIKEGALDTAIDAYAKAYELDPKQAPKIKIGLESIANYASILGNVSIEAGEYLTGAEAYLTAYRAQENPAYGEADPSLLYFAGYLLTVDGSRDATSFERGAKCLNDALAAGYADEAGDIYYYLFHCYYGQKGNDASFLMKAKDALLAGIEKFPKNEKILDGLMQLYTSEDNVGDPADLVEMIDNSLAEDPNNVDLWFGRGRVFYKLQNYDETINSFKKVVELQPDLYEGNYYLGLFYTVKADAMNTEMGKKTYMSQSEYDADLKAVNAIYMEALPYFEKAHAIKPDDVDTVDFMKSIAFRLRDEPGMMDKYNEYNTLLKQLKGEA